MVSSFSGRNPGSTLRSRIKLLISKPAPMSRTNETATSLITKRPRMRLPPLPGSRPLSFNVSFKLKLAACVAGAMPKIKPVTSDTSTVKLSTLASIVAASAWEIFGGMKPVRRSSPANERNKPTAPPNTDSKRSEEHTSELQSQSNLVCRLLLEKKKQDH